MSVAGSPRTVPARAQFLHAAARPRGHAACHLCRLAAAWHSRWACRRPPLRAAGRFRRPRAQHRLRLFRPSAARRGGLCRRQGRGARHRHRGPAQGRRAARCAAPYDVAIAAAAFVAIFFFAAPFPLIIAAAASLGLSRAMPPRRRRRTASAARSRRCRSSQTLTTAALWLAIWIVPLLVRRGAVRPRTTSPPTSPLFFSKLAVVTFGGAYSVLAYMAQQAVETYGWLSAGEMLDGLGLAETTPGPLILVTEFVGFLAGFRQGGEPKLAFGLLGAADHAVGDLRALLPVDLRRRALCRAPERKPSTRRRSRRRHRRRRRRDPEPEPVVRAARPVRQRRPRHGTARCASGRPTWRASMSRRSLLAVLAAGASARLAPRHRRHARAHGRSRARLVASLASCDRRLLARDPQIDEGRPHPGAVTAAIDARERRRDPRAAASCRPR